MSQKPVTEEPVLDVTEVRRRQKERARLMAVLLFGFVILVFGITIAKLGIWG